MHELPKRIIGGGGLPTSNDERRFLNMHKIEVIDATGSTSSEFSHYTIEFEKEVPVDEMTPAQLDRLALRRRIDAFKRMERPVFEIDALKYEFDRRYRDDFVNKILDEGVITAGNLTLKDGKKVNVSPEDAKLIAKFLTEIGADRKKIEDELVATEKGYRDVLKFAKAAVEDK